MSGRWIPDTCRCIINYTIDENGNMKAVDGTLCERHEKKSIDYVVLENRTKNQLIAESEALFGKDASGWSIDEETDVIQIEFENLSEDESVQLQNLSEEKNKALRNCLV